MRLGKRIEESEERYLNFPSSVFKYYFSSMQQVVGEVSAGTLGRAGIEFGKKRAIGLRKENRKSTLNDALKFIEDLGFGKIRIEDDAIYVEDSFEALAIGKSDVPVCHMIGGIIHGLCIGFALNYVYYEDICKTQGNDLCVFRKRELKWYERVQTVI